MPNAMSQPETFNKLRAGADAAFAMLAGIQLDVFTPLKAGSMTSEQLAAAMGVGSTRLRPLLYALVLAGLLTERDGQFSNTREAGSITRVSPRAHRGVRVLPSGPTVQRNVLQRARGARGRAAHLPVLRALLAMLANASRLPMSRAACELQV